MEKIKQLYQRYHEIIMYLIFGVATTLVNFIVTFGLQKVFNLNEIAETLGKGSSKYKLLYFVANAIAWLVAVFFAFVTNKKYVFESKTKGAKAYFTEMGKFFGARGVTGAIEITLPSILQAMGLTQSLFSFEGFWAKAATAVIVIILNYVFSKIFVFRGKKNTEKASSKEAPSAETSENASPEEQAE